MHGFNEYRQSSICGTTIFVNERKLLIFHDKQWQGDRPYTCNVNSKSRTDVNLFLDVF